ncbi:MAG: hypothetical protein ABJO27_18065 [Pseudoruegeria sp.]
MRSCPQEWLLLTARLPHALNYHLGLNFEELRARLELHILPYFPAPAGHGYRSKKSVGKTVLTRFLKSYQTVAIAARHLDIGEKVLRSKIDEVGIMPA